MSQPDLQTQLAPDEEKLAADTSRANASPYAPGTTKLLPEYKPSFGQRLVRGVEGFARGGVLGVIDPAVGGATPYGAPSKLYQTNVTQAQKDATADKNRLSQVLATWKESQDATRSNAKELGALASTVKDVASSNQAQQDQPNKDAEAAARTAQVYNESPAGKTEAAKELSEQTVTSRMGQINDPRNPISKMSTADKAFFLGNGRFPEPDRDHYHTPPEQLRYNAAAAAWTRDNPGKTPSVDTIRDWTAASQGEEVKTNKSTAPKQDEVSALVSDSVGKKQEWAERFDRNPDGSYTDRTTGNQITSQQFADKTDQFRRDLNVKLASKGAVMDERGNVVALNQGRPAPGPQNATAAAATPAPTGRAASSAPAATKPAAAVSLPPDSLLQQTAEGDLVHGKGGETFQKRGGRWVAQ